MGGRDGFLGVKSYCIARAIFRRAYLQYPHFRIGLFAQSSTLSSTEKPYPQSKNESHFLAVGISDEEKGRWKKKNQEILLIKGDAYE